MSMKLKVRHLTLAIAIFALSGCANQRQAELKKSFDQSSAVCLSTFPNSASGLSLKRNGCLIEAENRFVRPTFPFPDLLDLRQAYQIALAKKVDLGEITTGNARIQMAEVNTKITSIFEERRNARLFANSRAIEAQASSTNALSSSLAVLQSNRNPIVTTSCHRIGPTTNCLSY